MTSHERDRQSQAESGAGPAPVIPLRPAPGPRTKEPLWRHLVGGVLRERRLAQGRTLKDVADEARISMPYLSEIERGRKEASSEVLAAAAQALGLRLTDVLTLAQRELTRSTPVLSTVSRTAQGPMPARGPSCSAEVRLAA